MATALKEICRELNDRGITSRGKRWYKGRLHYLLTNEAYTGTAVWGRTSKGENDPYMWLSRGLYDGRNPWAYTYKEVSHDGEKWLRKSEQGDKWNRCLIEGMIVLSETGARDEQTTPP